jgi:hypothetical protein
MYVGTLGVINKQILTLGYCEPDIVCMLCMRVVCDSDVTVSYNTELRRSRSIA